MFRRALLTVALLLPVAAAQQGQSVAAEAETTAGTVHTPSLSRFASTFERPAPERFGVNAAAGTRLGYVQVQSVVLELTELDVSGLGNAGNAALEQRLRAALLAPSGLATLGESESRSLSLSVSGKTPAGTELTTQWQDAGGADVTLTQTLLVSLSKNNFGGNSTDVTPQSAGLVRVSSSDPVLAARLRAALRYSPRDLSLGLDAPYGLSLSEGESGSRQARRDMQPLLSGLTALLAHALGGDLPAPTALEPLSTGRNTLFQGRNSRGNLLFQVQGQQTDTEPWTAQWSGPLGGGNALAFASASANSASVSPTVLGSAAALNSSPSSVTLSAQVPAVSEFAQAIYRPDGLPDSAFEFGTLALRLEVQASGAKVQMGLQLRRTLALRPTGG